MLTQLGLSLVLVFALVAPPACSKSQVQATLQDAADTLSAERSRILTDFPDFTSKYDHLQSLVVSIKTAIDASDNLSAKNLIKDFLPLFDELIGKLGVNKKILDIVDIAIHIVLNHLPVSLAPSKRGMVNEDLILIQYKKREVWGCNTKPQLCKQL